MKRFFCLTFSVVFLNLLSPLPAVSEKVATSWKHDSGFIYDEGFMHMLMKSRDGGVCLFNMDLVQNDAPGAGYSEKGIFNDAIWGRIRARKVLTLDDPRANKAFLIVFISSWGEQGYLGQSRPNGGIGKYPLKFTVNGRLSELKNWDIPGNHTGYRWVEFPAEWLRIGQNVIDMFCPEAANEDEGWAVYLSRGDEFENGGGNPADVGKTSLKSTDGGKSWKESPFGPLGQTRAEYSVRLSLDRHVRSGWLASPVIDLWKGDSDDLIVPIRAPLNMRISLQADVPDGTKVEYFLRKGREASPFSSDWSEYSLIGSGASVTANFDRNNLNRRYVQFRAVLSTSNPLTSPVVKSAEITAELYQSSPLHKNIHVWDVDNKPIQYSSVNWEWEKWDRPEFQRLRETESLDEVVTGARTELGVQTKLLDYVTKRWRNNEPLPEYPGWDALSIFDHINDAGGGGMCIQLNNALGGLCLAYGYQARLVNIVGHEVCEVWNDDHAKWIYLDASWMNHFLYRPDSVEPLNMLDLHRLYTDYFFPDRPIDWMTDLVRDRPIDKEKPPSTFKRSSPGDTNPAVLTGFLQSAFVFMVPRNNWYEKPFPRPLNSGRSAWPWDGYINWYDEKTPPLRQHSWQTDRPRDMWPDLNKVRIDATSAVGNDRLFLRFETFTPNFSHFEVNLNDTGWEKTEKRTTWLLQPGVNNIRVRAVNKLGVKGHPASLSLNHANAPMGEWMMK